MTSMLPPLRKSDLVFALSLRASLDRDLSAFVVDHLFEAMTAALASGRPIVIKSFGRFELRERGPRLGRNPRTGETIHLPARRVVAFVPSPRLKRAVDCKEATS